MSTVVDSPRVHRAVATRSVVTGVTTAVLTPRVSQRYVLCDLSFCFN